MTDAASLAALIDDRPEDGIFAVDSAVFTDEAIFEAEMTAIFEGTWIFIGLASQLPKPHSFFTTYIGRQPVIVMKDGKGKIGCFLNTCRHRGTLLCPLKHGRQKFHTCRYHGWSYDSGGENVHVTAEATGQYAASFTEADHNLIRVPRFESYRGLLFASLNPDVPTLDDHLGDAKVFIDLVVDQSPVGEIEYVPGEVTYTFKGNWKLQFENGLDFYHFSTTHSAYVDILAQRGKRGTLGVLTSEDEPEAQGSFNFHYGHAVNFSILQQSLFSRPLCLEQDALDAVRERVGPVRAKWMLRQRNLTIYPNLQIIDINSAQIRTWRPLSASKTEMTSHCLGIVGERPAARRFRIRGYEDFFNPPGLASSDDNAMYELCQAGYAAQAGPRQGYGRGLAGTPGAGDAQAAELGITPVESSMGVGKAFGNEAFGGETNFFPGYREWKRLLQRGNG
ncbi:Large subunit of 2,4-D oxygenase [Sphingobium herbicidovorans NBRC 16415]|uniref:Large subunit of 2,4-D oxygenase n=1 Tax=Sphingobium herbicidovorans (strain ATCC 700291 / DSM 11019 / CCUG 56400 / KCTC 2939 / LMG 18315 / NBRC 16415 / MH) TaxID=1219045 RepID=A0A086P7X7_SPHHM|nr:aromatic ring-hydroxylating dioxygenase subunit alpha [Sphingobium herbicidovorans]KFG89495.1 Large subunit of 2,4-D oxygenase [Sphingobium herbicidovorans NBRC 16415]